MTAPTAPDPTPDDADDDRRVVLDGRTRHDLDRRRPDAADADRPTPARAEQAPGRPGRASRLRWVLALGAALVIFGAFLLAKGANPIEVYQAMWQSIAGDTNSIGELLVQSAPFLLAALAVAVPARAGLFNIGGEGQLAARRHRRRVDVPAARQQPTRPMVQLPADGPRPARPSVPCGR